MMNRRRAITILAGAVALPSFGTSASATTKNWQGIALGAKAQIVLDHPNADALISRAVGEIRRLENIFSLYNANSQLAQLNREGVLDNPAFEMVELLSICAGINARTNGAFDPTVQRLWMLYAEEFSAGKHPTDQQIAHALDLTGWSHIEISQHRISVDRDGVMLTLNGIAQGFIADKITALLRAGGVENVLVNTGEISAIGINPDGAYWQVKRGNISGPKVTLHNEAIATSAPLGTTFDANKTAGHILDPRTGKTGGLWPEVSVISDSAALSDGLSTAFCLMTKPEIEIAKGHAKAYL